LDTISLDNNPITTIESQALQTLSYVRRLDLTHTHLTTIDLSTFSGMNKLDDLDLSYNQNFKTITISNLAQIPTSLNYIKLTYSSVAAISSTVNDLINRDHFTYFDLSHTTDIVCDHAVYWMAKPSLCSPCLHCEPKLNTYGAKCYDGKTLLSDFLKASVKNPCETTTVVPPPTSPPTTTGGPTSGTPTVITTTGTSGTPGTGTTGTGTSGTGTTQPPSTTGPTTTGHTTTGTGPTQGPTTTPHKGAASVGGNIILVISTIALFIRLF